MFQKQRCDADWQAMGEGVGVMDERELVTAVVVDDDEEKDEDEHDDRDPLIGGQEQGLML